MKITILTAASSNHYKSVCQFIKTIPPSFKTIFYDIGLTNEERENLLLLFPLLDIRMFDFSKYPTFVLLTSPCAGAYAWKPIIIYDVLCELSEGILLWCDAGNKIDQHIDMLKPIIKENKIYTPLSSGTIQKWCHPSSLKYMDVPKNFLSYAMRNAAFVGILCGDAFSSKFIKEWKDFALQKDAILPEGADRNNHRHDQSILTYLFYKYKIRSIQQYIGFTCHNDIG